MATSNPRDEVRFDEVLAQYATYKSDGSTITYSATAVGGSARVGRAVKISTDDTVALAGDNDPIDGVLAQVEPDGKCSVQMYGFAKVPGGNGATLTVGLKLLGALDAGSVAGCVKTAPETVTTPTAAEVTGAYRAARTRARVINNDDPAAVVIFLG